MSHDLTPAPDAVHLSYIEPHPDHGTWSSPPRCLPSAADAERHVEATSALAGPDARGRRTWTVSPCDCPAGMPSAASLTSPARFDTGPSGAAGAGSRVDVVDGVAARSALEAVPDALDARPVAEGAEPHLAVEVDPGEVSHRSTRS